MRKKEQKRKKKIKMKMKERKMRKKVNKIKHSNRKPTGKESIT